ncbi:DNA-binding domain-containing protein [Caballeronia sp. SEWSISQ10-4 2]|uniref:HvfC/BufC family peptide modification chaperone n=1 Tax=Caballeronia sp. SEWSISQ10-4 2 TaxID=2937438 RepID=UPI00264CCF2C|nr:putative DNA-binding domain-containing protein [Caballeronia sp. SEWSISQ10-4 2]MDN7181569.1 DNA-binding domain-containing protein [Caballeronia sp. SEWSISQ10-4 2]
MTGALSRFQDDFILAIHGGEVYDGPVAALVRQPGFAVYRNTIVKGCIDALQANYPCIERLVGTEWFRAAAAVYVDRLPPLDSRLLGYGHDFADFLGDFEPAKELPYLPNVARLDRFWTEAHVAADEPLLDAAAIARLPPHELVNIVFKPQAAVRWVWFADQPAYTIWRVNREQAPMPDELAWTGEGALLVRLDGVVRWQALDAGACVFLDACARGVSLEHAVTCALDVHPDADVGAMLSGLLSAGAFAAESATPSLI